MQIQYINLSVNPTLLIFPNIIAQRNINKKIKNPENNFINIIHMNIRSLKKNFDTLQTFLNSFPKPLDVIALTETQLRSTTKHLYTLDSYTIHNLVRPNREHGVITIYTNSTLSVELIDEYCYINDSIEICTAEIKISNSIYILSIIYRPHSKHIAVSEFTTIITQLLSCCTIRLAILI